MDEQKEPALSDAWIEAITCIARNVRDVYSGGLCLYFIAKAQGWTVADLNRFRKEAIDALYPVEPNAPEDDPGVLDRQLINGVINDAIWRIAPPWKTQMKDGRCDLRRVLAE